MKILFSVCLLLPLLAGCQGPKGDMGASAPNTQPIYYYNNSFDSGGVSEWKTYLSGGSGPISVYLDSNLFSSPNQSLGVSLTGTVAFDSLAYVPLNIDPSADFWVEGDWNFQGSDLVPYACDLFVKLGSSNYRADIGFGLSGIYLVQNSTQVVVLPNPDTTTWHHIKIQVSPVTGKSSYWMDGLTLGTGYSTDLAPGISGTPSGYLVGLRVAGSSTYFYHLDNLQCYRF